MTSPKPVRPLVTRGFRQIDDLRRGAVPTSLFPSLTTHTVVTAQLAGFWANLVWQIWATVVAPLWIGGPLEPAALVESVLHVGNRPLAELIHIFFSVFVYPYSYLLMALPLMLAMRRAGLRLHPLLFAVLYGVLLWVFGLYVVVHLIAGLPPFLNFLPIAWASLVGHILFGLTVAGVVHWRGAED